MGFLSNMKKNLTGSWAEVQLTVGDTASRGGNLPVRVDVQVKDSDITVDKVIAELVCEEVIDVRGAMGSSWSASSGDSTSYPSESRESVHSHEVVLAAGQALSAGATMSFEGQLPIPAHAPPSARGRHSQFTWSVRGRLDMKGNDPDSGWQVVEVS
jgi:hypothetical protein